MEVLINKTQALQIAYSLLTGKKVLDDYGFAARNEAAAVIGDMIELGQVERELMAVKEPEPVKKDKPLTIADL